MTTKNESPDALLFQGIAIERDRIVKMLEREADFAIDLRIIRTIERIVEGIKRGNF